MAGRSTARAGFRNSWARPAAAHSGSTVISRILRERRCHRRMWLKGSRGYWPHMAIASDSLRRARPLLGTYVEITVAGATAPAMEAAVNAAFETIATVHRLMSFHEADSDVSRLNREAHLRA